MHALYSPLRLLPAFAAIIFLLVLCAPNQGRGQTVSFAISLSDSFSDKAVITLPAPNMPEEGTDPILYPADAIREGVEGIVRLKMLIAEDGSVSRSEVVDDGGDNRLVRASMEGLRKARFSPGTINGTPAEMWVIAEIGFLMNRMDAMEGPEGKKEPLNVDPVDSDTLQTATKSVEPDMEEYVLDATLPQYDRSEFMSLIRYPKKARDAGMEGTVTVSVKVGNTGRVLDVVVRQASDSIFIEPTVNAIRKLRFAPAMQHGYTIAMWVYIPIEYAID